MMLSKTQRKFLWKLAVSAAFLAVAVLKIDAAAFLASARKIHLGYYLASLCCIFFNVYILAWKFQILISPTGLQHSIASLARINYLCRFYSMFLSTAVGQSMVRWHLTTKNQVSRTVFIGVMVVERTAFLLVLCIAILISIRLSPIFSEHTIFQKLKLTAWTLAIPASLSLAAFIWPPTSRRLDKLLCKLFQRFRSAKNTSGDSLFVLYRQNRMVLPKTLSIGTIWHLVFLVRVYLLIWAAGIPMGFFQVIWMASLVLFFQVIPFSFNGLGVREAAYAYLFQITGLPPADGFVVGLMMFSQMLAVSAVGGFLFLFSERNDRL